MMDIGNKIVGNILGKTTKRGGKNDLDGDGVINSKDCQPKNTMRQDMIRPLGAPAYDLMAPGDMGESAMKQRMQNKSQSMQSFRRTTPKGVGGRR